MGDRIAKVAATVGPKPGYSITSFRMPVPGNLYTHGEAYFHAAKMLHASPKNPKVFGSDMPLFFCLAQATELFLKAFLSACGKDKALDGWQKHRLDKLLNASLNLGLKIKAPAQELINEIGQQNLGHELRFLETTKHVRLPPPGRAIKAIEELKFSTASAVRPFIRPPGGTDG